MVFIGYEFNNSGVDMKKITTLNVMAIILYACTVIFER